MAERFRQSDYDIGDLVGTILRSRHFFSEYAYRQRIKSPVEYAVGVVKAVHPSASPDSLVAVLETMGQPLFAPPNVKGWPGGKAWLNSATVLARQNFAKTMVGGQAKTEDAAIDGDAVIAVSKPAIEAPPAVAPKTSPPQPRSELNVWVDAQKVTEPAAVVNLLADLLLQGDIAEDTRKNLAAFLAEGKPEKAAWQQRVRETAHALLTLPEYTLA